MCLSYVKRRLREDRTSQKAKADRHGRRHADDNQNIQAGKTDYKLDLQGKHDDLTHCNG